MFAIAQNQKRHFMNILSGSLQRISSGIRGRFGGRANDSSLIKDSLVAEPWFVDHVAIANSSVAVDGWSFPGKSKTEFFINDTRFETIEYPLARPDVGKLFWQRRNSQMSGFHCLSTHVDCIYPNGIMKISRSGDNQALDAGRNAWYMPRVPSQRNLPDEDRRFRVIGNRDVTGFLNSGATDFHRLNDVARKLSGKSLCEFENVLDWGVGCGRLARHFPERDAEVLTGCDIDHDNVEWCRKHLKGRFVPSSLEPPLPFAADAFDVIYGVSVFTHLKEALQDKWLEELRRITKIGGLVLTTVHGETAVEFSRLPPDGYTGLKAEIRRKGHLVTSANRQLDGHVEQAGEYVNVFHGSDYVARRWSEYFEVLHVIPGYIFTHDLVVMRRGW